MAELEARVAIVDYGLGNLYSIARALERYKLAVEVSDDATRLQKADALILPGVGSFGYAMQSLTQLGLVDTIHRYAASGRPILGICLGMQLMMSSGCEHGFRPGLNLIPGRVTPLPRSQPDLKLPHIGWSRIRAPLRQTWSGSPLDHVREGSFMYFVHSYCVVPDDERRILAESEYGGDPFCAAVRSGNLYGFQFHPERSGPVGLSVYGWFSDEVRKRSAHVS